jgi:CMP-N-acetylneuraminic acid synthetase
MNILGITLARGGSKGVFKKNIIKIDGIHLIGYTIKEALKSKFLTDYIVSTDDSEIAEIAKYYGSEAPFLRPPDLSNDTASSVSALQHAVTWAEQNYNKKYDIIVELMVTNPLKDVNDIDTCIDIMKNNSVDSVIAVHRLFDHHPSRIKKIVNGLIEDFCVEEIPESRRQDLLPEAFVRSGAIYVLNRNYLMNNGRRYGSKLSIPFILPDWKAINIDSEEDLLLAEYLIKKYLK